MITVRALCTRIWPVLVYYRYGSSPEVAFSKKKMDLNLKKALVKCYIWSMALFGAETWTPQKVSRKCL